MTARLAHLVLALRVAYLVGAGLFLLDVALAFGAAAIAPELTQDGSPFDSFTSWVALIAFACAAAGAVITIAATSDRAAPPPPQEDGDTTDPAL